jgi:hypothetical protein
MSVWTARRAIPTRNVDAPAVRPYPALPILRTGQDFNYFDLAQAVAKTAARRGSRPTKMIHQLSHQFLDTRFVR